MFVQVLEVHILFLRIFIRKKEASGSFKPKAIFVYGILLRRFTNARN